MRLLFAELQSICWGQGAPPLAGAACPPRRPELVESRALAASPLHSAVAGVSMQPY